MIIDESLDGMRIDNAIPKLNSKITRNAAQNLIKEGKILLNKKAVKVSTKVNTGDDIFIPDDIEKKVDDTVKAEEIPIDIIYEDDDIIIVNKPKNMVVHPAVRK